jgi:hypothetical protein
MTDLKTNLLQPMRMSVNGRVVTAVDPLMQEAVEYIERLEAMLREAHAEIQFLRNRRAEVYLRSQAIDKGIAAVMSQIDCAVAELHQQAAT